MTHAEVGGILALQWKLPPLLCTPISYHHNPDKVPDPALRKLTELVMIGGRCADIFVDEEPAASIAEVRAYLKEKFSIQEADADA